MTGCAKSSSVARKRTPLSRICGRLWSSGCNGCYMQNPLRTDFQQHYEQIVAEYNREKDRVTIEKTFEELFTIRPGSRSRKSTAPFAKGWMRNHWRFSTCSRKPDLKPAEIKRIKAVACEAAGDVESRKNSESTTGATRRPPAMQSGWRSGTTSGMSGPVCLWILSRRGRDRPGRRCVPPCLSGLSDAAVAVLRCSGDGMTADAMADAGGVQTS